MLAPFDRLLPSFRVAAVRFSGAQTYVFAVSFADSPAGDLCSFGISRLWGEEPGQWRTFRFAVAPEPPAC